MIIQLLSLLDAFKKQQINWEEVKESTGKLQFKLKIIVND